MTWGTTLCVGLSLVAVALVFALCEHFWLRNAQFSEGTIIELIASRSSNSTSYRPRVRFTSADGVAHEFTRAYSSRPVGFVVGQQVTVAYDAQSYEGRIVTFGQRFGFAAVLASIGFALIVMATCFLLGGSLVPGIYLDPSAVSARTGGA